MHITMLRNYRADFARLLTRLLARRGIQQNLPARYQGMNAGGVQSLEL